MRNNISKLMFLFAAAFTTFSACNKVEDLPYYENGTAVTLTANVTTIAPTPADSLSSVVNFNWTNPNYSVDSNTVKFVLEIDSTGRNFTKAISKTITRELHTSLTGKELNAILLNYGFELGSPYELDVRVFSSYANNNERYVSNTIKLTVTPYNDPAVLTSDKSSVVCALATAAENSLTFSWTNAFNGYTGDVHYVLQYDSATRNFATIHEIDLGTNIFSRAMTQGEINTTALTVGIPGGNTGTVAYRLKATTAQGAVSYSAAYNVSVESYFPIARFYLPGSYQAASGYGNDWTPETAPELVRDLRSDVLNSTYFIYIYLPAGAQFKVTQGRSWDVNYGGTGGNMVQNSSDNFTVASAGVYRVSINRTTLKYDIRPGRMGFVGGGTGADWEPGNTFPTYAMGAAGTNLFVGLTNLTTAGQWKMIDNNTWNSGDIAVDQTRSYGTAGASGSTMEVNGGNNFPAVSTAGRYRVMWDGRNVDNIKYEISPATEMRLVGDGIDGVPDWSPGSSPQMTYNGNGVWTLTVALKADKSIKFLAGNDWGAFDYEDNSGGNNATGVSRGIRWEGGGDFKTPATAGTYTITLNEYTQTMRID